MDEVGLPVQVELTVQEEANRIPSQSLTPPGAKVERAAAATDYGFQTKGKPKGYYLPKPSCGEYAFVVKRKVVFSFRF